MTEPTIALKEYFYNLGMEKDADFLRQGVELLSQLLMEVEVEQQIGVQLIYSRKDRLSMVAARVDQITPCLSGC